eukprot:5923106-Prymnesium_polylepis.1
MARLPISPKVPPSRSNANDTEMKSSERLLSKVSIREPCSSASVPFAKAVPSRELAESSTFVARSCLCLAGWPDVPIVPPPSQCPYSVSWQPMPPVAACTSMPLRERARARSTEVCTVLHVTGSVLASSNVSANGFCARRGDSARAMVARGAWARPTTSMSAA